ncbi:MAG: PD-(D/E)XK nuclease family protein [Bacteroidales bacterium]|jgi:CRISPR/Cas system-associated exonuclease Cas4 (RecB family)|nr:PD-(D/E)XK nuclease family protein [Bacteroidales bacterium]
MNVFEPRINKTFLSEVVENLLKENLDFKNTEIIVPNKRTILFLKEEFQKQLSKTTFLPKFSTIKDVFTSNSNFTIINDLALIIKLFEIYQKFIKSDETLDDFYYWGEIILSDFDDIDKYLINPKSIFENIRDLAKIDKQFDEYSEEELLIIKNFWTNVDNSTISYHKEKFLELWSNMSNIYFEFADFLENNSFAYAGFLYKNVINNLNNCNFVQENYVFLGFNALNKCEEKLFSFLKETKNSFFYWDVDEYYLKDENQEAGRFLRKLINKFPQNGITTNNLLNIEKNIEIISVPSAISQLKLVPKILNSFEIQTSDNSHKTAIILADESLLIPLLSTVDEKETFNVSMGFPIKFSESYIWLNLLIELQKNTRKNTSKIQFKTKNVLNLLKHNFSKYFLNSDIIENSFFENKKNINSEILLEKYNLLFQICNSTKDFVKYFKDIFFILNENLIIDKDRVLEYEFLNKIYSQIKILETWIYDLNIELSEKIFLMLLQKNISSQNVAFEGEPLEGIQIMGFIETRSIDFENIIMLSINEDMFPKKQSSKTNIPYNLRKAYGLPSIEFQDSIFAYYFYRLIQRSKNIKILYTSQAGEAVAEASRFITQLKYELQNQEPRLKTDEMVILQKDEGTSGAQCSILKSKINITEKAFGFKIFPNSYMSLIGEKNDKMEIINNLVSGLDKNHCIYPTAINSFLNCPFQFYLKYVEKIKEPADEDSDSLIFGNLLHKIIEKIYTPFVNNELNQELIDIILKNFNNKINIIIKEILSEDKNFILSENSLMIDIVKKYVKLLLEYDKQNCPLTIIGLEKEYQYEIIVNNVPIMLGGKIDRVDYKNGFYRILDYKTGTSKMKVAEISDLFVKDRKSDLSAILQTLLYALIFDKENVVPGILNVNKLKSDNYEYRFTIQKNIIDNFALVKSEFIDCLKFTLAELLDKDKNFNQTSNPDNCEYCTYMTICGRR